MSGLTRDGRRPNPFRETKFSGANGDREIYIFSVQLTTSKIGNLTRLLHTLLHVMTLNTYIYIHTYDAACKFGELGSFVGRELNAFGRLRQALVHIQTRNSLGRRPRPSSTYTQPFRPVHIR